MPERALIAIVCLFAVGLVALLASQAAFLILLRERAHKQVWQSLGSPWFAYMQHLWNPRPRILLLKYIRQRHYLQLNDTATKRIGGLLYFESRYVLWFASGVVSERGACSVLGITWRRRHLTFAGADRDG
jgi:hypothetical protein